MSGLYSFKNIAPMTAVPVAGERSEPLRRRRSSSESLRDMAQNHLNDVGQEIVDPLNPSAYFEYGRLYFNREYLLPYDDAEKDRLDIFHSFIKYLNLLNGWRTGGDVWARYDRPTHVLDVGTGTGVWATAIAREYPNSRVIGIDQTRMQPNRPPNNCHFNNFDIEGPWHISSPPRWGQLGGFDLAYVRMMLGSIRDWPALYRNIFSSLRPGGRIEHVELDWTIKTDDNTIPDNSILDRWPIIFREAMAAAGKPINHEPDTWRSWLHNAGFIDIQETVMKMACNPWYARDQKGSLVWETSRWLNLWLACGIETVSLAPFARFRGMTRTEVLDLVREFQQDIAILRIHSYMTVRIWTARRP